MIRILQILLVMFFSFKRLWAICKNLFLVVGSVLFLFVVVFLVDQLIFSLPIRIFSMKPIPIIFPPYSEEEFVSKDFCYKVKINSIGVRNKELSIPKPVSIFRIVVIGDSYTYGWGVEEEQTWVRLIEEKIRVAGKKVEVVNLGKPGANLEDYLEIAKVGIPLLEPDLVVLALLQGDDLHNLGSGMGLRRSRIYKMVNFLFPNITRRMTQYFLMRKLVSDTRTTSPLRNSAEKNKISAQNSAREILKEFTEEEKKRFDYLDGEIKQAFMEGLLNPFLIYVAVRYPGTLMSPLSEQKFSEQPNFNYALRIIIRIKEISESAGARLVIFSVPQSFYVNEYAFNTAKRLGFEVQPDMLTSSRVDEPAVEVAKRGDLPILVITEEVRKQRDRANLFYPLDMHPTPEGHKLIAESLAPKLQSLLNEFYGN